MLETFKAKVLSSNLYVQELMKRKYFTRTRHTIAMMCVRNRNDSYV